MKSLKLGFILDPPEKIKCLEDTSFYLMKEAFERGHKVHYIDSRHVYASGSDVLSRVSIVDVNLNDGFKPVETKEAFPLASLDLLFIRKDPPFDDHYLYLTCLLELLRGRVPMVNDPAGLRAANEKFYILHFKPWITETLVSSELPVIYDFIGKVGDAVVKPPSERGGTGVFRVKREEAKGDPRIIEALNLYGVLVAQKFIPGVMTKGDKRILVLNGKVLGAYSRIPPKGDFRVSIYHDGRYERSEATEHEKKLVAAMAPKLLADGLYFAGLDVIDGFLTEVNVTSPAGVPEISHFAGRPLEKEVIDFIEGYGTRGFSKA